VLGVGPEPPSPLDVARARVIASRSIARGHLAGVLHEFDNVELDGRPTRRSPVPPERVINVSGVPCVDGFLALIDLAESLSDLVWEQALESALRKDLTTIAAMEAELPRLIRSRVHGTPRIRRVLALRPAGAPPTESLLETLMVQLIRTVVGIGDPVRQHVVRDAFDQFVARIDLSWPDLGLFIELDGEHHKGQPVYDASRETAIVAATGWLCGRFTWTEVVYFPVTTARRLAALIDQARRRPLPV
jgi:hypothetical protein